MLARVHRLRTTDDFRTTFRQGRRCVAPTLIMHAFFDDSAPPARAGLVVNKAVGIAVQRNRVKRRLRAALRPHLSSLPGGRVVIRALPASAGADFAMLTADVQQCIDRLNAGKT